MVLYRGNTFHHKHMGQRQHSSERARDYNLEMGSRDVGDHLPGSVYATDYLTARSRAPCSQTRRSG